MSIVLMRWKDSKEQKAYINNLIDELKALAKNGDPEAAHGDADKILCELLIMLGYKEVIDAYSKIEKWYA